MNVGFATCESCVKYASACFCVSAETICSAQAQPHLDTPQLQLLLAIDSYPLSGVDVLFIVCCLQAKPKLVEPLDYENVVVKNKALLHNDPLRDLLLFPLDDVSVCTCIASPSSQWNILVHVFPHSLSEISLYMSIVHGNRGKYMKNTQLFCSATDHLQSHMCTCRWQYF